MPPTIGIFSRAKAAAHLGIPVKTFSKLQDIGVLPTDATTGQLDQVLAELFQNGLPWPAPIRRSQWRGFPFTQPIWKEVGGGLHLYARWRHLPEDQRIPYPFGSAHWIKEWFACERRFAAAQKAGQPTEQNHNRSAAAPQPSQPHVQVTPESVTQNAGTAKTKKAPTPRYSSSPSPAPNGPMPLYPDEHQIAVAILGSRRAREWKAKAVILERAGLPPIDPLMGGRPWHAVEKFFATRNELDEGISAGVKSPGARRVRCVPFVPDGREVLNGEEETAGRRRRKPDRP
jgi:hypothetical protein